MLLLYFYSEFKEKCALEIRVSWMKQPNLSLPYVDNLIEIILDSNKFAHFHCD